MSQLDASNVTDRLTPSDALRALSMAWSTYELYPNPRRQAAFTTAVGILAGGRDQIVTYEIGAGRITSLDEELEIREGATGRLALRLFVHDVERLELVGAPSADDLDILFRELALDEEQVVAKGGIAATLRRADVATIDIVQRGILSAPTDPWSIETSTVVSPAAEGTPSGGGIGFGGQDGGMDQPEVLRLVHSNAPPQAIASAISEAAGGDVDKMAGVFLKSYEVVHQIAELVESDIGQDLEKMLAAYQQSAGSKSPLVTFVETFFLLPQGAQARILEIFLENIDRVAYRLLIDQFAGLDLVELSQLLSPRAYEQLADYIRDVVDADEGAAEDLLPLIRSAREVEGMRTTISDRVVAMLGEVKAIAAGGPDLRERLQAELRPDRAPEISLGVVQDLFECETRSDRFDRLVKSWTNTLVTLLRARDLDQASEVLKRGRDLRTHSELRRNAIEEGLAALTASHYDLILELHQDAATSAAVVEVVAGFGPASVDRLVTRLAVEESPAIRRTLVGLIGELGAVHPEPILERLSDSRWYLVRNLVPVIAKLDGGAGAAHLPALLGHEDDRVVGEALRALAVADPNGCLDHVVDALEHPVARVRETACIVLRTSPSNLVDGHIRTTLLERKLERDTMVRLAETLRDRGTAGRAALVEIAGIRPMFRASRRRAKQVARQVLEGAA